MTTCLPTRYTVYPDDYDAPWLPHDKHMWTLNVDHCGDAGWPGTDPDRRWAVRWFGRVWTTDTGWEIESQPSSRDAAWFARARFSCDEALRIAAEQVGQVEVNGSTFEQMSRRWFTNRTFQTLYGDSDA